MLNSTTPITQVAWLGTPVLESTREPESSLPKCLIGDYECGVTKEIHRETMTTGSQTIHTLSTISKTDCDTEIPPHCKHARVESSGIISDSSG